MKLVNSNKARTYTALITALTNVIALNTEPLQVFIDYTIYRDDIAIYLRPQHIEDPRLVMIVVGKNAGDVAVTYFSHQSIHRGDFNFLNIAHQRTEEGFIQEYKHNGFLTEDPTFHFSQKVEELAMVIVHFIVNGSVPDVALMKEHFPHLAESVVSHETPKLK